MNRLPNLTLILVLSLLVACSREKEDIPVSAKKPLSYTRDQYTVYLEKLLKAATSEGLQSFQMAKRQFSGENFYVIGFDVGNDVMGLYAFANTEESLLREFPKQVEGYRWLPNEWGFRWKNQDCPSFPETNRLLNLEFNVDGRDFTAVKYDKLKVLNRALKSIRDNRAVENNNGNLVSYVHISDAESHEVERMLSIAGSYNEDTSAFRSLLSSY